jgi:hypothetical protein
MPCTHAALMIINFITGSRRLHMDGLKAFAAFGGMILQCNLVAEVAWLIYKLPQPFDWEVAGVPLQGTFIWFEVEVLVFCGTLFSNAIFIALRTCMRHKI